MRPRSALSPSHLPLLLLSAALLEQAACDDGSGSGGPDALNVTWISPAAGDVFGPGDDIVGRWTAPRRVESPAFELCMLRPANGTALETRDTDADEDANEDKDKGKDKDKDKDKDASPAGECGAAVWPAVHQESGQYYFTLAVPDVMAAATFYLRMRDDFGRVVTSPRFSLSPNASAATNNIEPSLQGLPTRNTTTLASANTTTSSTGANTTAPGGAPATAPTPYVAVVRTPPPTAAIAVPLSFVGAILLAACAVAVHSHRQLGKERAQDAAGRYGGGGGGGGGGGDGSSERLSRGPTRASGGSGSGSSCSRAAAASAAVLGGRDGDVEKALYLLSRGDFSAGYAPPSGQWRTGAAAAPLPRQTTRQAFNSLRSSEQVRYERGRERERGRQEEHRRGGDDDDDMHDRRTGGRRRSVMESFRSLRSTTRDRRRHRPPVSARPSNASCLGGEEEGEDDDDDATLIQSVIAEYSRLPDTKRVASASAGGRGRRLPTPPALLAAPQRLHVRNEACVYDDVPLSPPVPLELGGRVHVGGDVYDAVYRAVRGR